MHGAELCITINAIFFFLCYSIMPCLSAATMRSGSGVALVAMELSGKLYGI